MVERVLSHTALCSVTFARRGSSRLLFDVFGDAVSDFFVAALNLIGSAGDEFGGTEAEDIFLVLKVLATGDETGFDEGSGVEPFAALAAAAEEEFSDGQAGGEHEKF